MASLALQARLLYRDLLRGSIELFNLTRVKSPFIASNQFTNYYFREYARRRTREDFRANRNITDQKRISELLSFGRENLGLIKRQALIGRLYGHQDLVVETTKRTPAAKKST